MKKICISIALMSLSFLFSITEETGSLRGFIYGNEPACEYDNYLSHVSEGIVSPNYNLYAPYDEQTNGFGDFIVASSSDLSRWNEIAEHFLNLEFDEIETIFEENNYPYSVVEFHDTDTDRTYYMLRENLNMSYSDDNNTPVYQDDDENGSFDYGWGLYIYNPEAENPFVVTTPHPNDDFVTVPVSCKAFQEWNAKFWLIAGAGREVKWTQVGTYYNSKSLSDPTRVTGHVYNKCYQAFADHIRENFPKREFSVQIHSYDWNRHKNHNNLQISPGAYSKKFAGFPIRDLSDRHNDILNVSPYVIHPANEVGIHPSVTVEDFYSFYCPEYPFNYVDGDFVVPAVTDIDLPGYGNNKQMIYTTDGYNDYETFEPFFHIEMDELPNCYEQTESNYHWFYGYDAEAEHFDFDNIFTHTLEYYSPWIDAVSSLKPDIIDLDDEETVAEVTGLEHCGAAGDYIKVKWDPVDCFDFKNYRIRVSEQPLPNVDFISYTPETDECLACAACSELTLDGLEPNKNYYIQIDAFDMNGNSAIGTTTCETETGAAEITLYGKSFYDFVKLTWNADEQFNNAGFVVERKESDENEYQIIADWQSDSDLLGSEEEDVDYEFRDENFEFGKIYDYRVSGQIQGGNFVPSGDIVSVYTDSIMVISVTEANGGKDSVRFGINYFATDNYETGFDIKDTGSPTGINARFYEEDYYYNNRELFQNIKGDFDLEEDFKEWILKISTPVSNQPVTVHLKDMPFTERDNKRIMAKLVAYGSEPVDLGEEDLIVDGVSSTFNVKIYYGKLIPWAEINSFPNQTIQPGIVQSFSWSTDNKSLIESLSLYLVNETDTLLIAEGMANDVTSYSYSPGENDEIIGANLMLKIIHTDGSSKNWFGTSKIDVIPAVNSFSFCKGWSTVSNPFIGSNFYFSSFESPLFAEGIVNIDGNYQYHYNFDSENPYWIFLNDDCSYDFNGNVRRFDYSAEIGEGWQQVFYPYWHASDKSDLDIVYNDVSFSFAEAVQNEIISPHIFVYDESCYKTADVIEPGQSYFIFCRVPTVSVNLSHYPDNPKIQIPEESEWSLTLGVKTENSDWQNVFDTDEIKIKAYENCSDDFDIFYDIPAAPEKPFEENVRFTIIKEDDFSPYPEDNLFCEGISLMADPEDETEEKVIPFKLNAVSENPLIFYADRDEFPDNYSVLLELGDRIIDLTSNDEVIVDSYEPEQEGNIYIRNILSDNEDNVLTALKYFKNFPNPFNPETVFSFYLSKQSDVKLKIYNIKGQCVAELADGFMEPGKKKIMWNGTNKNMKKVASGIYFAGLSVNNHRKIKKVMLLK